MDKNILQLLIKKYLSGKASEQEIDQLNNWYSSFDDETVEVPDLIPEEKDRIQRNIFKKIRAANKIPVHERKNNLVALGWLWKVAAAVIVISGVAVALYLTPAEDQRNIMITQSTLPGQKKKFVLSDGTSVNLNSESQLTYPQDFSGDKRQVSLVGEAFFEVAKDPEKPFVIHSDKIFTEVLGTSFDVNAYPLEDVAVTVATGRVRVFTDTTDKREEVVLIPGDRVTYRRGTKKLIKGKADIGDFIAWKDGLLKLEGNNEEETVFALERWFGVDIEVTGNPVRDWNVNATYDNKSLEFVLNSLSYSLDFEYSISNNKVIIKNRTK